MREIRLGKNSRGAYGAALLFLLAFCGYIGAFDDEETQMVSVPVTRIQYEIEDGDLFERTKAEYTSERDRAIELLQGVADNSDTDEEMRKAAIRQISEIADTMEIERKISLCLREMGYLEAVSVRNTHGITLILRVGNITDQDKTRIIDAVCGISDCTAGDIKIILAKK